jgi:hypothetical protein
MALQKVNNGDSGLNARNKINAAFDKADLNETNIASATASILVNTGDIEQLEIDLASATASILTNSNDINQLEIDLAAATNKVFQTLTDASTISWTYSNGYNAKVTLGGDRNITITGATNGDYGTLFVIQGSGTPRVINFGANDGFAGGTYSFSSGTASVDIFTFVYDGTNYYWNFNKDFASPPPPPPPPPQDVEITTNCGTDTTIVVINFGDGPWDISWTGPESGSFVGFSGTEEIIGLQNGTYEFTITDIGTSETIILEYVKNC